MQKVVLSSDERKGQCWIHSVIYLHVECWDSNADQIHTTTTTQLSQYTLAIERSGKSDEWMDLVEVFSQAEWISGRLELFWAFLPLGWAARSRSWEGRDPSQKPQKAVAATNSIKDTNTFTDTDTNTENIDTNTDLERAKTRIRHKTQLPQPIL